MENLRGFHYQYSGNNYTESDQQSSMAPPPAAPTRVTLVRSDSSSSDAAFLEENSNNKDEDEDVSQVLRARVASHPLFSQLFHAYIDCHKLGAPPEMVQLLDGIIGSGVCQTPAASMGVDPELDHFMETYCNLLEKYKSDLSRPFGEATAFLNHMETQLNSICNHPAAPNNTPRQTDETGSSEKDFSKEEKEAIESKRINEDHQELKDNLLRRYSGYISNLKHEVSKNKKKEKLPKEAKQILLTWWDIHFKWPYPTDADKVALAEWTGLDQKQVNNWFINQRKRHWKPTNEMQAAILDGLYGPLHELE